MSDNNNSLGGYLFVAVAAAAVGAGLALLYAPHTGKVTRKMLMRKGRALKDSAVDTYEDAMDFIEEKKAELEEVFESTVADLKSGAAKVKKSA